MIDAMGLFCFFGNISRKNHQKHLPLVTVFIRAKKHLFLFHIFDKHYPSNREKFIKISLFCKSRFAKLYKIRAKSIRITLNKFPPIISKFIAKVDESYLYKENT